MVGRDFTVKRKVTRIPDHVGRDVSGHITGVTRHVTGVSGVRWEVTRDVTRVSVGEISGHVPRMWGHVSRMWWNFTRVVGKNVSGRKMGRHITRMDVSWREVGVRRMLVMRRHWVTANVRWRTRVFNSVKLISHLTQKRNYVKRIQGDEGKLEKYRLGVWAKADGRLTINCEEEGVAGVIVGYTLPAPW